MNRGMLLFYTGLCISVGYGLADHCHEMWSAAPVLCPKFTKAHGHCVVDRAVAFEICAETPGCKYVLTTINFEWNTKFAYAAMLGKDPLKSNSEWTSCELSKTTYGNFGKDGQIDHTDLEAGENEPAAQKLQNQNMAGPLEDLGPSHTSEIGVEGIYRRLYTVFSPETKVDLKKAVDSCLDQSIRGKIRNFCFSRKHGPIGEWNVSGIYDMQEMFVYASTFDMDLSKWDVSRVTNMRDMFYDANSFNQDVSKWDVSRVEVMAAMFYDASAFNQDVSKWDVSRVEDMEFMFRFAYVFNVDISEWDVSRVTNMGAMFNGARSFNKDVSKWDVSRVIDIGGMFHGATSFNMDVSKWNVSSVDDMNGMFHDASPFNMDVSKWDVSHVTYMNGIFCNASSFNMDLSKWDMSRVITTRWMFRFATLFNTDVSKWNVSSVTDMNEMFLYAPSFNQDVSKWDVSRVTNMDMTFFHAKSFNQTLCSEAWVNSKASKFSTFVGSRGSISTTVCGFSPQTRDDLKKAVNSCVDPSREDKTAL